MGCTREKSPNCKAQWLGTVFLGFPKAVITVPKGMHYVVNYVKFFKADL